jgi:hypothetical protein
LVGGQLAKNRARFDAERTRKKVISKETFQDSRVLRYLARPFDLGYCYYSPIRPLWNEPRPGLWADYQIPGNWFVLTRRVRGGEPEGTPFLFTRLIGDDHALRTDAYFFPIRVTTDHGALMGKSVGVNLSGVAREYLAALGLPDPDTDDASAEAIWLHTLAIGFSPEYRRENKDGIAVDWPRIPLPRDCERLQASIALGRRIVELLDTERSVPGITSGSIDAHLRPMGPISATDLRVTAGWGRLDSEGRVSPGQGRYERRKWTDAECALLREGFGKAGLDDSRALELLGDPVDVYLNNSTFWRGVPEHVWDYFIGGYQVVKKWLSYREQSILGRQLKPDEAREITAMVRRLSALVLLTDRLDENYRVTRDDVYRPQLLTTFGGCQLVKSPN